jgi:hypothetical protein
MTFPKSKRLRFSIAMIVLNFVIGIYGIHKGADLSALGSFLALANSPLYAYILGDSLRPSKEEIVSPLN